MASPPLLTFGLLTDVQAAAKETVEREGAVLRYSEAPTLLGEAVDELSRFPISFLLHAGDIVDGRDDEERTREDLETVLAQFGRIGSTDVYHVLGNHCVKFLPRAYVLKALSFPLGADGSPCAYYRKQLCEGWELVVLDTTDLSIHGGWSPDSAEHAAAVAYMEAHPGEPRMQRYNGGVGKAQLAWLRATLADARASRRRVILVSHHCLAAGACRETHLSWNGDEVVAAMRETGVVALALAGHDHKGGYRLEGRVPHVTIEAIVEAPAGSNAFAVVRVYADRVEIDGLGTSVTSRTLPLPPPPWAADAPPPDGLPASVGEWLSPAEALPSRAAAAGGVGHLRHATAAAPASDGETAAAASSSSAAAHEAEAAWLLDDECGAVFGRMRTLLTTCAGELHAAASPSVRSSPLRGGSEEEGFLMAAVVGATGLHALRVQVTAPKWNQGQPYTAMLSGGARADVTLPPLLVVRNRVTQALAALEGNPADLNDARECVERVLAQISDAARTLGLTPPPTSPSPLAAPLTAMLQPPPPPGLLIDVNVAGAPPRLIFSAHVAAKGGDAHTAAAEARHVPTYPDDLIERHAVLERVLAEAKALLAKLEAVL